MRFRPVISTLLIIVTFSMLLSTVFGGAGGQVLLVDDATFKGNGSDDYEFVKLSKNPVVIGTRPSSGNGFDIKTFEDTTYDVLIESSESTGNAVNFVVLDGDSWASPPNLGAQISSNPADYIIEMENEVDDHPVGASWVCSMEIPEGGPILNFESPGSSDDEGVYGPSVVFASGEYHMWYTIFDSSTKRIGYATSTDGIEWKKYQHPVINPTVSWEEFGVSDPSVLYKDGEYHMWYTGDDGTTTAIGYATSQNGIDWIKNDLNPVFEKRSGSLDGSGVSQPSVLYVDPYYHMWYAGYDGSNYRICYARSNNGIKWTRHENPILNPTIDPFLDDSWDRSNTSEPSVIYDGSTYHMWYAGDSGSYTRVGYATSDDGLTWTKYKKNPVLNIGPHGSWDDTEVTTPGVIQEGTTCRMWYSGNDGNNYRIGYVSSENLGPWIKIQSYPEVLDTHIVTGIIEGLTYTMELDVPLTVDLDMFLFSGTGGRDDALTSSIKSGAGSDESITFTAPISGDYIMVITNEDGGTGMYTILTKSPPIPNIVGNLVADENGIVSLETEARYPSLTDDPTIYPGLRVAISPDGSYLAVGWGNWISFFSTESNISLWSLDINEFAIDFKFTDNGEYLAVLGEQTLYFFHTSSCNPLWSYNIGYCPISITGNRMDMSRDGRFIATKAWGNRVLIFDTTSATPTNPYWEYDFGDEVLTVKISGDGRYLAMGGKHGHEFRLASIPGRSIEWTYNSDDPFMGASISFDGSTISFGQGLQHTVGLFYSTSSTPEWTYEVNGTQHQQAMSDDGGYFVSTNAYDRTPDSWGGFLLWDTKNSNPIWEYHINHGTDTRAYSVDMDRDANYVVGGDTLNNVYLFSQLSDESPGWSEADRDPVYTYPTGGWILANAVSISADGTYFAAGSYDGTVYLFSTIGVPHHVWSWDPSSSALASGIYSWDFDASVDSNDDSDFTNDVDFQGSNPTYTYKKSGNYTVTLTITAEDGAVHSYTMFVTVDIKEKPGGLLEDVLGPGLPLAAVAIMAALLVCLFAGRTEVGKYRLIPIAFPLYSRLRKDELLDQDTRSLIYRYIKSHPGENYNSIKEELNLNNGTLAYHLKTLEREEYIKSMRDGIYKRFYPVDVKVQRVNGFGIRSVQGRMIMHLIQNPGLTQRDISGALKLSQQVVSYHLNLMMETGHIRARRQGKTNRYFVNESIPFSNM